MGWPTPGGSNGDPSPIEKISARQEVIEKLAANIPEDFLRCNLGWPDTGEQVQPSWYLELEAKLSKSCVILPFTVSYKENPSSNPNQQIREGLRYYVHVMPLVDQAKLEDQVQKLKVDGSVPPLEVDDLLFEIEHDPLDNNHPLMMFYSDIRKADPRHGGYRRDPHSIIQLKLEQSADKRRLDPRLRMQILKLEELEPSSLVAQAEKRKARKFNKRQQQYSRQIEEPELPREEFNSINPQNPEPIQGTVVLKKMNGAPLTEEIEYEAKFQKPQLVESKDLQHTLAHMIAAHVDI